MNISIQSGQDTPICTTLNSLPPCIHESTVHYLHPRSAIIAIIFGFLLVVPFMYVVFQTRFVDTTGFLVPILILLFFFVILVFAVMKIFIFYKVTNHHLILYKPPFRKRVIKPEQIRYAELLTEKQTTEIMAHSVTQTNESMESGNITGVMGGLKKDFKRYRYFTIVPKPFQSVNQDKIQSEDIKSSGKAVILVLKSQEVLYLSPKKSVDFINSVRTLIEP